MILVCKESFMQPEIEGTNNKKIKTSANLFTLYRMCIKENQKGFFVAK